MRHSAGPHSGKLRLDLLHERLHGRQRAVVRLRGGFKHDVFNPDLLEGAKGVIDRDRPHVLLEIHPTMLKARFGGSAEAVVEFFRDRGYRMFALNRDRLEERTTVVEDLPWKDYFFIHPARAARLPAGVFKARMAA